MALTFSRLGNMGRIGNAMFQLAFLYSLALKHNGEWAIPPGWKYQDYFFHQFPVTSEKPSGKLIEPSYKYHKDLFSFLGSVIHNNLIDVEGYFQHEEYWPDKNAIKELFRFKKEFVNTVYEKYKHLLHEPAVIVCVRRGDYVGNPNYHNLSPNYYLRALESLGIGEKNLIFMSDDIEYCKFHYSSLPKTFFPTFESDIEALCFGTLFGKSEDAFIIANSTFHWWMAYLAQPGCGVSQPDKLFAGDLLRREGDYNFYRKEWWTEEDRQVDLTDVTFTIPVKYDHPDREHNLKLIVCLLQKHFDTNIVIGEQGGNHFEFMKEFKCDYIQFDYEHFHRTKMLNQMAASATTEFVANWDADVMVPPAQLYEAIRRLRGDPGRKVPKPSLIYPYDNLFVRIPKTHRKQIYPTYDLANYLAWIPNKKRDVQSVGGAVIFNRIDFINGGGENENFISYSSEDKERYHRFNKLGYVIDRVPGNLYHFDHWCGPDSSKANPFYQKGVHELEAIEAMSKEELKKYIATWQNF